MASQKSVILSAVDASRSGAAAQSKSLLFFAEAPSEAEGTPTHSTLPIQCQGVLPVRPPGTPRIWHSTNKE
ncbi:MAG: hypothetical protein ABSG07_06770 [Terriglobales bacterium]